MNGVVYDPNDGNVYAAGSGGVTVFSPSGGAPNAGAPGDLCGDERAGHRLRRIHARRSPQPHRGRTDRDAGAGVLHGNAAADKDRPPLAAAPIAIAYGSPLTISMSPQTVAQLYVTSASGIAALDPTGTPVTSVADPGDPFGIVDRPQHARTAGRGAIRKRASRPISTTSARSIAARSFFTPSALGLTQPQGVCDVF